MALKPLNSITVTINAQVGSTPGLVNADYAGGFLFVEAASATFTMQFDSGPLFAVKAGFTFSQNFNRLTLSNSSSLPITVTLIVGESGVNYVGDNTQVDAPTYAKGNLGINSSAAATMFSLGSVTGYSVIVAAGSGYKIGDTVTVNGGTVESGSNAATFEVSAISYGNGAVRSLSPTNAGIYSTLPTNPNSPSTSGSGTGLQLTLTFNPSLSGFSYDGSRNALVITDAATITIPNFDGANRRKQIVIEVINSGSSGAPSSSLVLMDANGNVFTEIAPGAVEGFSTSAAFQITSLGEGSGSTNCEFIIGEIYYQP